MQSKKMAKQDTFAIGAVAKLTGLTDHTIRVWERRYGAVVADRGAGGRRCYTPLDVSKLGLLKLLTDRGISIGQIARKSLDELREQANALGTLAADPVPESIAAVALGDFLPGKLRSSTFDLAPIQLLVAETNRDAFEADLARRTADVVVVEVAVLDAASIEQVGGYRKKADASRAVMIYTFGSSLDLDTARAAGIVALRAPVTVEEVHAAVLRAYAAKRLAPKRRDDTTADAQWDAGAPTVPRRFNQQQLANLANVSTAIDCECPQHLAQLVSQLSAFEIYSANCANRDEEDAALHRYLHQTTAEARSLIETALEKVAIVEGLKY